MEIHPSDCPPNWLREDEARHERSYLRRVVGLALVAVVVIWATGAYSQPLSHPTNVAELFAAAIKHGGFTAKCQARPGGCPAPGVLVVTIEDDNINGQFDPSQPTFIRINALPRVAPGTLAFNEVLVHEFVHYLQWLFGELGPQSRCSDIVRIESQAYKAGAAYMAEFGIIKDYTEHLGGIAMMAALCEMSGGG